jgi:DNA invertase Pin-like site-specific DNA recombinase
MSRRSTSEAVGLLAGVQKRDCAVYTRVSTDEQTSREYNSLHAQRDACEAYVESQRPEGWLLSETRYDDGGSSGATLDRPALKRLRADIESGLIKGVVVYKIDRLSRSLADFLKLVEDFDRHGVTFVSITQSFNTATSMGRLVLIILLGFAQYERELIGERIRDMFAASRARGQWMGGKAPLGYEVYNRKLVVRRIEAGRVCRVFELFVETGSGLQTARRLQREGITTRSGKLLDKGNVYKLLNNRTYIGEVTHKGNIYAGEQQAIVSRELWNRAHSILAESHRVRANRNRVQSPALLRGLIFGADGRAMSPTHTGRRGRLYRYYVSQSVLKGQDKSDGVRRVSAAAIERAVIDQIRGLLSQPEIIVGTWMAARAELPELTEDETREALQRLDPLWDELFPVEQARIVRLLVDRVEIGSGGADIRLQVAGLTSLVRDLRAEPAEAAV